MSFESVEHRLLDMLIAARHVRDYIRTKTSADFESDTLLQDAVTYQVQTIGEAASHVPAEYREAHPEIPWGEIVGMRHRIVHDYRRVDLGRVWSVAINSVPQLIAVLESLVPPPPEA
jgi:uncharacterized protein with HEPN domain